MRNIFKKAKCLEFGVKLKMSTCKRSTPWLHYDDWSSTRYGCDFTKRSLNADTQVDLVGNTASAEIEGVDLISGHCCLRVTTYGRIHKLDQEASNRWVDCDVGVTGTDVNLG